MNTFMVITGALMVGGVFGFFLAACLSMGSEPHPHPDPLPEGEGMLRATPEEIVAVYERGLSPDNADDLVMVDYFPMSRKALKGWEKEQSKREKRRMR